MAADTNTPYLNFILMAAGNDTNNWITVLNSQFIQLVELAICGNLYWGAKRAETSFERFDTNVAQIGGVGVPFGTDPLPVFFFPLQVKRQTNVGAIIAFTPSGFVDPSGGTSIIDVASPTGAGVDPTTNRIWLVGHDMSTTNVNLTIRNNSDNTKTAPGPAIRGTVRPVYMDSDGVLSSGIAHLG